MTQGAEVSTGTACRPGDCAGPAGMSVGEGLGSQVLAVGGQHGVESVRACVSTPMTNRGDWATVFIAVRFPLNATAGVPGRCGPAPCPGEVTSRQNCDGPRPLGPGKLHIRPPRWAGLAPAAHHGRTVHRQGTQKGARFVMSHNRGDATNANPASRSRTSQVKTHSLSTHRGNRTRGCRGFHDAVEMPGKRAFEAPADVPVGLALKGSAAL